MVRIEDDDEFVAGVPAEVELLLVGPAGQVLELRDEAIDGGLALGVDVLGKDRKGQQQKNGQGS